jgi:hypothetical protein
LIAVNKQFFLCTENYTLNEVNLLIEVLQEKFGLKATANKRELKNGTIG